MKLKLLALSVFLSIPLYGQKLEALNSEPSFPSGAGFTIPTTPTLIGGFVSSDGSGNAGTWEPLSGSGGTPISTIPGGGLVGLMYSTDGTGNAGTWAPCSPSTCGGGGATGSVTSVSVVTANGVSGTVATATTTPAITLTLGAITPTSTNGVSAATMAFMDATSSVQTQLNGKQATLTLPLSTTNGGTGINSSSSTGVAQVASGTWTVSTTLPSGLSATNLTLITPALGTPSALVLTNATGLPAAQLLSGALVNGMTATTQSANDNSTKLATTAYVDRAAPSAGTPTTIPNLMFWLSADRVSQNNSTNMPRWYDTSTATQAVASNNIGAVYQTSQINGLPAVNFNANSANRYTISAPPALQFATIFAVVNPNSLSALGEIIAGGTDSLSMYISTSGHIVLQYTGVVDICTSSATLSVGTWYQVNATYNQTTGACAIRVAEVAAGTGTQIETITVATSDLGWFASGGDLNANLAEVIVYNRVLSGGEITTIETYLHTKYGI